MSKDLVVYEGIVVSVSHGERDSGVLALQELGADRRRKVLASVASSLDMYVTKVKSGGVPTPEETDNFCKDVGLWFCERVRTGEADKARVGGVQ